MKSQVEKIKAKDEFFKQIVHEMKTEERFVNYFKQFESSEVESFIKNYARQKILWYDLAENLKNWKDSKQDKWLKACFKALIQIQQKKLFNAQCLWRAEKTKLEGVLLIKPVVFEDHRGEYLEIYNKTGYKAAGVNVDFVEDDISTATRGVIKGVHGDTGTWKLISCLHGKFYLVVLNYDEKSKDYGKWQSFVLSDVNRHQVLIPPLHGNGHQCLSEKSIFHYKQSEYYDPKRQFTVRWNDERFNMWWPIKNPILSRRDEGGGYVE